MRGGAHRGQGMMGAGTGRLLIFALTALLMLTGAVRAGDAGPYDDPAVAMSADASGDYSDVRTVKLGLNKSTVVDLPRDARDVLVSNPDVADAVIRTPRRIYLTGVAVGQTNIILFDRAGQQIVSIELEVERDPGNLEAVLDRFIPNSYIEAEIINDNIVLSGTVRTAADSRKAEDIAIMFANGGQNTIKAGGGEDIRRSGVINLLNIEGEDQVQLKVTIAEVQRNVVKQLGIDWDIQNFNIGSVVLDAFTTRVFPINGATGYNEGSATWTDGQKSVGATIEALEQNGLLRTLAEPTLTAISGEKASFLAGGEFPYQTVEDNSTKTEFKPFGVSLSFAPVVLSEGRISLKVETEVSEIVPNGGDTPSLNVRRASTTLELPSGGSMVLGGLIQDNVRQSLNGVPGLKKLPILGTLFRSRDYQRNETELVIFITPYLVKPTAPTSLTRPDKNLTTPDDLQATFMGRLNNIYGGGEKPTGTYKGHYGYIYE